MLLLLPLAAHAGTIEAGWPPAPEPAAEAVEPMDCGPSGFASADVAGPDGARVLRVTVEGVGAHQEIQLQPYVYVMQPEYWAIGVVACRSEPVERASQRTVTIELALADAIGTRGIEVVGTGAPRRFDLR